MQCIMTMLTLCFVSGVLPAAVPGLNSSQETMLASQNPHSIEPADLQLLFLKTYLECIVIPDSRWLNILDKDHAKIENCSLR